MLKCAKLFTMNKLKVFQCDHVSAVPFTVSKPEDDCEVSMPLSFISTII